jgi:hypothetical protein
MVSLMALSFANASITEGLVSYWSWDSNFTDLHGTNDATAYNKAKISTSGCMLNGCLNLSYDSTNSPDNNLDYVTFTKNNFPLGSTEEYTVICWVKLTGTHDNSLGFFNTDTGSANAILMKYDTNYNAKVKHNLAYQNFGIQNTNIWHMMVMIRSNGKGLGYLNATLKSNVSDTTNLNNVTSGIIGADNSVGSRWDDIIGFVDECGVWNRSLSQSELTTLYNKGKGLEYPFYFGKPVLSNYNCTSCNIPFGDTSEPYTTSDTTPTFSLLTDIKANCSISDQNLSYANMGSSRTCSTGQKTTKHICTLPVSDELKYQQDYVYVSCANSINSSAYMTTRLEMDITGLGDTSTTALIDGVQNSIIWPGAMIYQNQKIYLRNLQGQQMLTTVDVVAVYGNKRWLLNYVLSNETILGLFNITPVIYSLDMTNMSNSEIESRVSDYIGDTG